MAVRLAVYGRARSIRLLVLDVDGVLTDAGMYYSESGDEWKKFNTRDGRGIGLVQAAGIRVAIVTGEQTAIVTRRAAKLGIEIVRQGVAQKLPVVQRLAEEQGVAREDICYVGDDGGDLEPMRWVGLAVAVADAAPEIRKAAHWVTRLGGGQGAVREVCDVILAGRRRDDASSRTMGICSGPFSRLLRRWR